MHALRSLLIRMLALQKSENHADIRFEGSGYSFKIPMNDPEVVHILQTICHVCQLRSGSVEKLARIEYIGGTHKSSAVCIIIFPNELVDVSIVHPLGNHRKSVFADRHPKER
jgi:hypothetical protein